MFQEMVVKKNAAAIAQYYHPDFILYTNGQETHYTEFLKDHEEYYATPVTYHVEYDEQTFFEQHERVAGRMWITVSGKKIEVILVIQYKDGKIYRLWELTYPDWSQLPTFMTLTEK